MHFVIKFLKFVFLWEIFIYWQDISIMTYLLQVWIWNYMSLAEKYVFFKKEKVFDSSGDKKIARFAVQGFSWCRLVRIAGTFGDVGHNVPCMENMEQQPMDFLQKKIFRRFEKILCGLWHRQRNVQATVLSYCSCEDWFWEWRMEASEKGIFELVLCLEQCVEKFLRCQRQCWIFG